MLFFANEAKCPTWVLQSEVDWFRYRTGAAFDTFAFIWCHKNPSMHLESLQCVKPLAAMGLSARAIQTSIETISSQGH